MCIMSCPISPDARSAALLKDGLPFAVYSTGICSFWNSASSSGPLLKFTSSPYFSSKAISASLYLLCSSTDTSSRLLLSTRKPSFDMSSIQRNSRHSTSFTLVRFCASSIGCCFSKIFAGSSRSPDIYSSISAAFIFHK